MKNRVMILLLIISVCAVTNCAHSESDIKHSGSNKYNEMHIIQFKGEKIWDSQAEMMVSPNEKIGIVSINSQWHKFHLIVPYSNSLEIKTGPDTPLYAINHVNGDIFSILKPIHPICSAEEYLLTLLTGLKKDKNYLIRDDSLIERDGQKILKYRASDPRAIETFKDRNTWSWNYWVAGMKGSEWYVLHWSKTDEILKNDASNATSIYKVVTFFADGIKNF